MTINTESTKRIYSGNGTTTDFDYDFKIFVDTDLLVTLIDAAGNETVQVLNTDYTVTGEGFEAGGKVKFTSAPAAGVTVLIQSDVPYTQPTDLKNQGRFFPETHENAFDRATRQALQVSEKVDRALKLPARVTGVDTTLPTPVAGFLIGWNAAGTALRNIDPSGPGDLTLRSDLADPTGGAALVQYDADETVKQRLDAMASDAGASLVGFKQSGTGAVARTAQDKLRERVSVKDFGAVGDGVTNDSAAILAAIAALQASSDERGRTLFFPAGHYKCPVAIDFTSYNLIHGIYVEGEGDTNTLINFAGAAVGTDGITFGKGAHFGVRKIMVANAPRHNIVVGRGTTVGGPSYASMFTIECVRSQGAGQDGIYIQNAYLGRLSDIWARACGRNGITLAGFHTSIHASRCWASNNAWSGWAINGLVYGTFEACGSDENGMHGWALSNLQGVTFNACGSESNQCAGFYLFTSNTSAIGLVTQSSNIRGVEFIGCYALSNSLASAGTYGTFIDCSTADSRPAAFAIRGGVAHGNAAGDRALVLTANSGSILCINDGFDGAAFLTGDLLYGAVEVQNRTMTGRRCILGITSQQSIPNNADTTINVLNSASPIANDLGATVSTTGITIPRGVNKVIVSAAFGWEDSPATGVRMFKVFKNGAGFAGMPTLYLNDAVYTLGTIRSAPISVSPGDVFSLVVWQNSGAAHNTLGPTNAAWFCVEAVC